MVPQILRVSGVRNPYSVTSDNTLVVVCSSDCKRPGPSQLGVVRVLKDWVNRSWDDC